VALQARFGVSQRRACLVAGQYRATQRRPRRGRPDEESRLRERLRELARAHPRWGWRMAWRVLRREPGQPWTGINHKRVQRLWREEGLRRPVRTRKRRRVAPGTAERLRAERPNQVWAVDFQFDETADGRRLKLANLVDEHTREALAMRSRCASGVGAPLMISSPSWTPWSPSGVHPSTCVPTTARS
jgi:putative transposase